MHPFLYKSGGLTVSSYGLMLALSFVVGAVLARSRAPRHGVEPQRLFDVILIIVIAALVGSRLLYIAEHASTYAQEPGLLFQSRQGGLSMYGGVALAAVAVAIYCARTATSFVGVADACAPSLALGEGLTRIGCFLNGCCFGVPSSMPWATVFPEQCAAGKVFAGVAIHPTQLYSSLAHFAILAALLAVGNRTVRPGTVIGLFLVLHAAVRLAIETIRYRTPSALEASFGGIALFPSRLFCLGLLALGCYVLLTRRVGVVPQARKAR